MLLGVDHLVIAVNDPDAAAATMEADLGIAVTGGGRHERGGTFNRLAFLGDAYLELIGVFNRRMVESTDTFAVGQAALALLDAGTEGLATYALASDDVAAEVGRLRDVGSPIGAAVSGSRVRPDGEVVRWITAFPPLGPEECPFLIEHELVGAEWGTEAREARAEFRHPAGGTVRLTGVTIPVADPDRVAARYRAVLGITFGSDGRAVVHGQTLALAPMDRVRLPIVDLAGEAGSAPLDTIRFGVRWRRQPGIHGQASRPA